MWLKVGAFNKRIAVTSSGGVDLYRIGEIMKPNLIKFLSIISIFSWATSGFAADVEFDPQKGIPSCPALHQGKKLIMSPPLDTVQFSAVADSELNSEKFKRHTRLAANVLSYFEDAEAYVAQGGGRATYSGISKLDGLSIGQFQWNWKGGVGTLTKEFMVEIDRELVETASPGTLRKQLIVLKDYASGLAKKSDAQSVVNQLAKSADRLNSDLERWLVSEKVKAHQDKLVKDRMDKVWKLTKTWIKARQLDDSYFTHVFIYFANLNVHAGITPTKKGLRNVWIPQLEKFKSDLGNNRETISKFISDWMLSCKPQTKLLKGHPDHKDRVSKPTMAGGVDAFGQGPNRGPDFHWGNAYRWADQGIISKVDEAHFDLFIHGYLFASRSQTNDEGKEKAGWVQLDVLNRAGYIALRNGLARGTKNNKGIIFGK